MKNKKADNTILNKNIKQEINKIDDKIDLEKKQIKRLDKTQEEIVEFNRDMKKCIQMLSKVKKNPKNINKYSDMYNSNDFFLRSMTNDIEEKKIISKKQINNLSNEKEKIIKEKKK